MKLNLLREGTTNYKTNKRGSDGFLRIDSPFYKGYYNLYDIRSFNLSMAPYGTREEILEQRKKLCTDASPACLEACVAYAGRGFFPNVMKARQSQVNLFFEDRAKFMRLFIEDIHKVHDAAMQRPQSFCKRDPKLLPIMVTAIRSNLATDVAFETLLEHHDSPMHSFPWIQWYDYTAILARLGREPANYHLTFSRKENNAKDSRLALEKGYNLAVLFRGGLPETYKVGDVPYKVINGDLHDFRFLDNPGSDVPVIVGLTPKGRAKKDKSEFAVDYTGPHM